MELEASGFIFSVAATFLMLETSQKPKQFWYFAHIIYFCFTNWEGQEDHLDVSGASAIKRTKGIEMAQKSRSLLLDFSSSLSQCLKIIQNVSFEITNFDIFQQFLSS